MYSMYSIINLNISKINIKYLYRDYKKLCGIHRIYRTATFLNLQKTTIKMETKEQMETETKKWRLLKEIKSMYDA